ncbi:hypothetical protein HORIV_61770 [Vreelandella olivaria]|uniref:Uncharacterized protein n=1 Tax=Vreelandella olivaria TaxID=390919 RepID=A0ABM7GSG1_9GAMM|nr:hypothetical protein HORIV_61770 [Halomonas olivaria]
MQDLDPLDDVKEASVAGLLIDSPGANGIKNNTDFFVKRGRVETVCPECAALALLPCRSTRPPVGPGFALACAVAGH